MLLFSPFEASVSIQKWMSYNCHNIGYVIDDHHPSTKGNNYKYILAQYVNWIWLEPNFHLLYGRLVIKNVIALQH